MDKPIAEDLKDGYAAMNRNDEHEDWVAQLIERVSAAEARVKELEAQVERIRKEREALEMQSHVLLRALTIMDYDDTTGSSEARSRAQAEYDRAAAETRCTCGYDARNNERDSDFACPVHFPKKIAEKDCK